MGLKKEDDRESRQEEGSESEINYKDAQKVRSQFFGISLVELGKWRLFGETAIMIAFHYATVHTFLLE